MQVTSEAQLRARAHQKADVPLKIQLLQADAQIAQCLQQRRVDPQDIAASVFRGLAAVQEALAHFMASPPRIGQGLNVLGTKLLQALDEPVRAQFNDTSAYTAFTAEWMAFFDKAPETVAGIQGNLTAFNEEGRPQALVTGLTNILIALSDGVVMFVPVETAQEIVTYVDAVTDLLDVVGNAWTGFESGHTTQAIEDLYFGLRATIDQVIPSGIQNNDTYSVIVGTLDGVVGDLSETVLAFQRHVTEGSVCWKVQEQRQRRRPNVCPEGFHWNGEQFCNPGAAAGGSLLQSGRRSIEALEATTKEKHMDRSTQPKRNQRVLNGAQLAVCVSKGGAFPEQIGHWCYAACPDGMVANGRHCRTQCQGSFPADDGAMMCGHNPGVITEAIVKMIVSVGQGVVNTGLSIADIHEHGVDTNSLVRTINAFIDMGKPFAYQTCPTNGR
jgi:hypothetical protein